MDEITPLDAYHVIPNPFQLHTYYPIPGTPWEVERYNGRGRYARSRYLHIRRPIPIKVTLRTVTGEVLSTRTEKGYQEFRADLHDSRPAWGYIDRWNGKMTLWRCDSLPANPEKVAESQPAWRDNGIERSTHSHER